MTKAVILYANKLGCFLWRNNTMGVQRGERMQSVGGLHGGLGSPDVVGLLPNGVFIGVEIKNGKDKLSISQIEFHDRIFSNNGFAFVVTQTNLESFFETLKELCETNT